MKDRYTEQHNDDYQPNTEMFDNRLQGNRRIGRREFLRDAGLLTGGAVVAGCQASAEFKKKATETIIATLESVSTPSPENMKENLENLEKQGTTIRLGMNTHLSVNPAPMENLTIDAFKADVEKLSSEGIDVLRLNVWEWETNDPFLLKYQEALQYAKTQGMKIYLVTNVPQLSPNFSDTGENTQKTIEYYQKLSSYFKGLVDTWQIFNEADDHTYSRYGRITNDQVYPEGYLRNFAEIVKTANDTIKSVDPEAKTTVNVSIWNNSAGDLWVDNYGKLSPRYEEVALFDVACGFEPGGVIPNQAQCSPIDSISLDLYFDTDYRAIEHLPDVINYFRTRYQKPVIISEVGLPSGGDGRFTPTDQADSLAAVVDSLQKSQDLGQVELIIYEMRDEFMKAESDAEAHFGITDYQGNSKPAWNKVLEAWRQK